MEKMITQGKCWKRFQLFFLAIGFGAGVLSLHGLPGQTAWRDWLVVYGEHTDLDFHYDEAANAWNLLVNRADFGDRGLLYPVDTTVFWLQPGSTLFAVPAGLPPSFSFLGDPGDMVYLSGAVAQGNELELGFAAYGVDEDGDAQNPLFSGPFGGEIEISLATFAGDGEFVLYSVPVVGTATVLLDSTRDPDPMGSFQFPVQGHIHYNWLFRERGVYILGVTAGGVLAESGNVTGGTDPFPVFFLVDPRPVDWWRLETFREKTFEPWAELTADASGDGVPNLMAYAFGYDPRQLAQPYLPRLEMAPFNGADRLSLVVRKPVGQSGRDDRSDLAYVLEHSPDLVEWSSVPASGQILAPAGYDPDGTPLVRYIYTGALTPDSSSFLRLRIRQTP